MTVEKGDVRDITLRRLPAFISWVPHSEMTVALIDPLPVQMQRCLQMLLEEAVKHGRPEMNREWDVHVPTADKPGRLYTEYDITTQEYRFALRLDNLVVQQRVKESMYV